MSNTAPKLPTQRTDEPALVTASGFEHLPLHEMTGATSVRVSPFDDTPNVTIDLTKVDPGNVQHPDRRIKHKVRAGTIAMRTRTADRLYSIAAGFSDAIDDGVDWLTSTFDQDESEGRRLMTHGVYSLS